MFSETSPPGASISNKWSVRVDSDNFQGEATIDSPKARNPFNGAQIPYIDRVSVLGPSYAVRNPQKRKHLFFSPKWPHFQLIP